MTATAARQPKWSRIWLGMTLCTLLIALVGCSQADESDGARPKAAEETAPSASVSGSEDKAAKKGKPDAKKSGDQSAAPGKSRGSGKKSARRNSDDGMPVMGPNRKQTDVLDKLPGSTKEGCVSVGDRRDVRSGTMAAGPFDDVRRAYKGGTPQLTDRSVRLYFIPESSAKMPGVHVKMVHKATGQIVELDDDHVTDAEEWKLYDIETALPTGGTWVIRAQAGADSGCWEFDLT